MLVFAVLVLTGTGRGALLYCVLFAVCGLVSARYLPWRFAVLDEGIALWFAFGRRLQGATERIPASCNLHVGKIQARRKQSIVLPNRP